MVVYLDDAESDDGEDEFEDGMLGRRQRERRWSGTSRLSRVSRVSRVSDCERERKELIQRERGLERRMSDPPMPKNKSTSSQIYSLGGG